MALNIIAEDDDVNSEPLRENFEDIGAITGMIREVYISTGFDSTQSGAGSDEQSHELTSISAANLGGSDYIVITAMVTSVIQANQTNEFPVCEFKIQTQDLTNLTYSDSLAYTTISRKNSGASFSDIGHTITQTVTWVHTLTNDEKTNGMQVKMFSKSTCTVGDVASVTNVQTVIKSGV